MMMIRSSLWFWACGLLAPAACSSDGGSSGAFELTAGRHVDIAAGGSGELRLEVVPENGFRDAVSVTLVTAPDGITADPLTVPAGATSGALTLHVGAGKVADATLAIQGVSSGGVRAMAAASVTAGIVSGLLDPAFGDGGITSGLGTVTAPDEACRSVAMQPDDKIIVSVSNAFAPGRLIRVNPDGTKDPGFGSGGEVTLAADPDRGTTPVAVAIAQDGKIWVLGYESKPPGASRSLLWRFAPDGTPDTSLGATGFVSLAALGYAVGAMALRDDGGVDLVGGSSGTVATARIAADGELDPTYGTNGTASFAVSGSGEDFLHVADGGWLVSIAKLSVGTVSSTLLEVTPAGAEGATAAIAGATLQELRAVGAAYLDVAFTLSLTQPVGPRLERRLGDLTLDTSFGTAGSVPVDSLSLVFGMLATDDGKVVLAGGDARPATRLVRLAADGTVDTSFRADGTAALASLLGAEPNPSPCSSPLADDSSGRLVLGTLDSGRGLRLLRFLP